MRVGLKLSDAESVVRNKEDSLGKQRLNAEKKKAKVAYSARRLFVNRGFHDVSISDIVADSGVSTGTIYSYYGSKVGLAQSLYNESSVQLYELLTEQLLGRVGSYNRLKAMTELLMTLADEDSTFVEFLFLTRHQDFFEDYRPVFGNSSSCLLYRIVDEGIIDGDLCPGDPLIKSVAYLGVIINSIQAFLNGLVGLHDDSNLKDQVVQCAWNSVYH